MPTDIATGVGRCSPACILFIRSDDTESLARALPTALGAGLAFLAVAENAIRLEGGGATSHTANVVWPRLMRVGWSFVVFYNFLFCRAESRSYNAPCAFGPRYFAFCGGQCDDDSLPVFLHGAGYGTPKNLV